VFQLEKVIEPLFVDYLDSVEPLAVPNYTYSGFDLEFTLSSKRVGPYRTLRMLTNLSLSLFFYSTDLSLNDISWSTFSFQISQGVGFDFTITNLAARMAYLLHLTVTFPPLDDTWAGVAELNDTDVSFTLSVKAKNGQFSVIMQNLVISIGYLDLNLPE
jgi:hypothetical protein